MSSSPILDNMRQTSPEITTQWNILCNSSKKCTRKKLIPTTKVRLDLGAEERKNKLEQLAAEPDPLTRLMNDILGDKV